MAAEVSSSLVRVVNGGADKNDPAPAGKSPAPITRDFLGGSLPLHSKELDMDLQVPCGWEKRMDLKSGKVFLQRYNSSTSQNKPPTNFQDLNHPTPSKQTLNLFDDSSLDLKLFSSSRDSPSSPSPSPSSSHYQSVCTLDKVKSALERAEKETSIRKGSKSKSSSPRSNSSCSIRDCGSDREEIRSETLAAGCPNCLLYVLISRSSPNCPRCNGVVPLPAAAAAAAKKPRIDLNMYI